MNKQILPYSDIRIGMKCYNSEGEYAGIIEFIGTMDDMFEMEFRGLVNNLHTELSEEELEDCQAMGYQWVIVDPNDMFGPYLANYNCDPSGVVCYKEEKLYTREEVIKLLHKSLDCNITKLKGLNKIFHVQLDEWIKENLPNE